MLRSMVPHAPLPIQGAFCRTGDDWVYSSWQEYRAAEKGIRSQRASLHCGKRLFEHRAHKKQGSLQFLLLDSLPFQFSLQSVSKVLGGNPITVVATYRHSSYPCTR